MFEVFATYLSQHWFLSTYLGTMAFNESAILGAFSLLVDGSVGRYFFLGLAATLGVLTNDLILYGITHFGLRKITSKVEGRKEEIGSIFERVFFHSTFLSLLFLKFLVGIRTFLTIYLLAEKKMSLKMFVLYDLCGILLYVIVLGVLGTFIGNDADELGVYHITIRIAVFIAAMSFFGHILSFLLRKKSRNIAR